MKADSAFGPWLDHDGMGCPVPVGTVVIAALHDPFTLEDHVCGPFTVGQPWRQGTLWSDGSPAEWVWSVPPVMCDGFHEVLIVRYRVQRPAALRQLVTLIEALPAPEGIDA